MSLISVVSGYMQKSAYGLWGSGFYSLALQEIFSLGWLLVVASIGKLGATSTDFEARCRKSAGIVGIDQAVIGESAPQAACSVRFL